MIFITKISLVCRDSYFKYIREMAAQYAFVSR